MSFALQSKFIDVDLQPGDTPSEIAFSHNFDLISVSCWDGCAYFYNYKNQPFTLKSKIELGKPLLTTIFQEQTCIFGSTDGNIGIIDLNTGGITPKKIHTSGVTNLKPYDSSIFISSSWDSTIKVHDQRTQDPVATLNLPNKVYNLDFNGEFIMCTTAGNKVILIDPKTFTQNEISTQLQYSIRSASIYNNQSIILSSIDGKGEYIDFKSPNKSFVFKAHRTSTDLYAINVVKGLSDYNGGYYITGGSDGSIAVFNHSTRQRSTSETLKSPINCISRSFDGQFLAIGVGYDWSRGFENNSDKSAIKFVEIKNLNLK